MGDRMQRCVECKGEKLEKRLHEHSLEVAGHPFHALVEAETCTDCGAAYFTAGAIRRVELLVCRTLSRLSPCEGAVLRYMRKALGWRAVDLAKQLGVQPETVSRWENDRQKVDRSTFAVVAGMIEDRLADPAERVKIEDILAAAAAAQEQRRKNVIELGQISVEDAA